MLKKYVYPIYKKLYKYKHLQYNTIALLLVHIFWLEI